MSQLIKHRIVGCGSIANMHIVAAVGPLRFVMLPPGHVHLQTDIEELRALLGSQTMPLQDNEVYHEVYHEGNWPVKPMLEVLKAGARGRGLDNILSMAHATYERAPLAARHSAAAFRQWLLAGSVSPAIG